MTNGEVHFLLNYSFGPCKEFVPPFRFVLSFICFVYGGYCAIQRSRSRGWVAGLYTLYVVAMAGGIVILLESGHQYYCDN